jgi:transposase InsO family protein
MPQPARERRASVTAADQTSLSQWIRWYNERRPHQALGYLSPHQYRAQQLHAVA